MSSRGLLRICYLAEEVVSLSLPSNGSLRVTILWSRVKCVLSRNEEIQVKIYVNTSEDLCFMSDFIDTLTLSNHLSLLQSFDECRYNSVLFCTAYKITVFIFNISVTSRSVLSLANMCSRARDVTYNSIMIHFSILCHCIDLCVHRRYRRSKVRRIGPLVQQSISLLCENYLTLCRRVWITENVNFRIRVLIIILVPKKVF